MSAWTRESTSCGASSRKSSTSILRRTKLEIDTSRHRTHHPNLEVDRKDPGMGVGEGWGLVRICFKGLWRARVISEVCGGRVS
jgi:hypothetical protein